MAKLRVNRIDYNPSTNELTIWTNGQLQYIFDMDNIGGGGGSNDWDDLVNIPSSIQNLENEVFPGLNKITVVQYDGTVETFNTLQDAFDSIPEGTDATTHRNLTRVYIPAGTYDESVTINIAHRLINVICLGPVNIGYFSGSAYAVGSSTVRNLTIHNGAQTTIDGLRSSVFFSSILPYGEGVNTHNSYMSKLRINGDLNITDATTSGKTSEILFEGQVFGNVVATSHVSGAVEFYTQNSRYNGTITGSTFKLQKAINCRFIGLVNVAQYSIIQRCYFEGGMTVTAGNTGDVHPDGMYNTDFKGTFTGPSGSLRLDTSTNYFFILNSAILGGSATKVLLNNIDQSASDITIKKQDPSVIFDAGNSSDTKFWLGVQDDNGNDNDDLFQIGRGTTPGSNSLITITKDGNLGIGYAAPESPIEIVRTLSNTTGFPAGIGLGLNIDVPSNSALEWAGIGLSIDTAGNAFNIDIIEGYRAYMIFSGSGIVEDFTGIYVHMENGNTGTIEDMYGFYTDGLYFSGSSTTTNAFGMLIESPGGSGTVHNYYGIYIGTPNGKGDTLSYALYSEGGLNYFGGNFQFPTTGGVKIGTATNQLLGFYGATPVDQPATISDPSGGAIQDAEARTAINTIIDRLQELGLIA